MSKMTTRRMFTYQNQRHLRQNLEVSMRPNIMECGDGIVEHHSNLQRSVFHRFDSPNYQNPYQWRSPGRPLQPPQTDVRPSVFSRLGTQPHVQKRYSWRNPDAGKAPEQSTVQWRETLSRGQIGTSQVLNEDLPEGINVIDFCPQAAHTTASGSGVCWKAKLDQHCYQINKKNDGAQINAQAKGDARSGGIARNNSVPAREQFGKVSPLNRPDESVRIDAGYGTGPVNAKEPVPGQSYPTQADGDLEKLQDRVFKCLSLFVEKPWSREDIEWITRVLSSKSTPVPPEPSVEGLAPREYVIVEPIRWLSDNPGEVKSLSASHQNTQCERITESILHRSRTTMQICTEHKIASKRRAPRCLSEMEPAPKQTKVKVRKLCRKRKATEDDCLDTMDMAPPIKKPRLI